MNVGSVGVDTSFGAREKSIENKKNHHRFKAITPEMIERSAAALDSKAKMFDESDEFECAAQGAAAGQDFDPYKVADVVDEQLKKTAKGRKVKNGIVAMGTFAATVFSFKRVIPKLVSSTGRFINKAASKLAENKNLSDGLRSAASGAAENGKKLADGTGNKFAREAISLFAGRHTDNVIKNVSEFGKKFGIKNAREAVSVGIGSVAALFASREAADFADGEQKEKTVGDVLKIFAKIFTPEESFAIAPVIDAATRASERRERQKEEDNCVDVPYKEICEDGTVLYHDETGAVVNELQEFDDCADEEYSCSEDGGSDIIDFDDSYTDYDALDEAS